MTKKSLHFLFIFMMIFSNRILAQFESPTFGSGLNFYGADKSFQVHFGFRFQNLYIANWDLPGDDLGSARNYEGEFLIRRARLKFDGYAFSPKLKYKMELGLTNRDISGGSGPEFSKAANIILDAYVDWNFAKGFYLKFGQAKLPGNRERVISSADLQTVDRSLVNSHFNIDRDFGLQLRAEQKMDQFEMKEWACIHQGEGRDVTSGDFDGYGYTFRAEMYPFGAFDAKDKDDYVGSDFDGVHDRSLRPSSEKYRGPKLAIGATYSLNQNAVRTGGQLGSFMIDSKGNYVGKDLRTFFLDAMFKIEGLCFLGEFANRKTTDGNPVVYDTNSKSVLGKYYTGNGYNFQAGYMLNNYLEPVVRYTRVNPDVLAANGETQYTIGLNKFFKKHKLKLQSDITYRSMDNKDDGLMYRLQMDVHF